MCLLYAIFEQKTLRRDCIYNIENTDIEIGVSGVYVQLLLYTEGKKFSNLLWGFTV